MGQAAASRAMGNFVGKVFQGVAERGESRRFPAQKFKGKALSGASPHTGEFF